VGVAKWYIDLDGSKSSSFNNLEMVFLNHFHLPVRYNVDMELLAKFEQTKVIHISYHIQEWICQKRFIKVRVPPAFFLEWFLKSLVPCVSKAISTFEVFSEEEAL